MTDGLETYEHHEQGYMPLVYGNSWMVALLNHEPIMDVEKAVEIEGVRIFRTGEEPEDGNKKIFWITPGGRQHSIGERAFSDYFKELKKH